MIAKTKTADVTHNAERSNGRSGSRITATVAYLGSAKSRKH